MSELVMDADIVAAWKLAPNSAMNSLTVPEFKLLCEYALKGLSVRSETAAMGCDVCGAEPGRCMTETICRQTRERRERTPQSAELPISIGKRLKPAEEMSQPILTESAPSATGAITGETPRTDAVEKEASFEELADFARQLERELESWKIVAHAV